MCVNVETICLIIFTQLDIGGILSPKLYSVYIDDLFDYLLKCQIACQVDNVCVC